MNFFSKYLFLNKFNDESTARSKMNLHFRFLIDDGFLYLVILGIMVGIDAVFQYDCFVIAICEEIKLQGERALIPVTLTAYIPVVVLLSGSNDVLADFALWHDGLVEDYRQ